MYSAEEGHLPPLEGESPHQALEVFRHLQRENMIAVTHPDKGRTIYVLTRKGGEYLQRHLSKPARVIGQSNIFVNNLGRDRHYSDSDLRDYPDMVNEQTLSGLLGDDYAAYAKSVRELPSVPKVAPQDRGEQPQRQILKVPNEALNAKISAVSHGGCIAEVPEPMLPPIAAAAR